MPFKIYHIIRIINGDAARTHMPAHARTRNSQTVGNDGLQPGWRRAVWGQQPGWSVRERSCWTRGLLWPDREANSRDGNHRVWVAINWNKAWYVSWSCLPCDGLIRGPRPRPRSSHASSLIISCCGRVARNLSLVFYVFYQTAHECKIKVKTEVFRTQKL